MDLFFQWFVEHFELINHMVVFSLCTTIVVLLFAAGLFWFVANDPLLCKTSGALRVFSLIAMGGGCAMISNGAVLTGEPYSSWIVAGFIWTALWSAFFLTPLFGLPWIKNIDLFLRRPLW